MRLAQFMRETGATEKQIHYWRQSIPMSKPAEKGKGSGYQRDYFESAVPKVRLLVHFSNELGRWVPVELLRQIYDQYDEGFLTLACGITLEWQDELY